MSEPAECSVELIARPVYVSEKQLVRSSSVRTGECVERTVDDPNLWREAANPVLRRGVDTCTVSTPVRPSESCTLPVYSGSALAIRQTARKYVKMR
jgi:hypothetical protein